MKRLGEQRAAQGYDPSTGYLTQTVRDYGSGRLNAATQFTYDGYGHVAATTDPNGHTTSCVTDALGHVTEIDGALGEVEQKSYDGAGNLTVDQKQAPGGQWEKTVNVYNGYEELAAVRRYTDASNIVPLDEGLMVQVAR